LQIVTEPRVGFLKTIILLSIMRQLELFRYGRPANPTVKAACTAHLGIVVVILALVAFLPRPIDSLLSNVVPGIPFACTDLHLSW
jgi:hypothetical protein